ncbi:MAG TPA: DNA gyrase inhibitor YacG [Deltaproteobacteria bacterium]|nr:DNA gyrase inhibitor YacG [Deltaproteobacteria bacterium]
MPTQVSCPTCKKIINYQGNPHRPFCSERCRRIDLGAWAAEEYAISGSSSEGGGGSDFISESESDLEGSNRLTR